MDTVNHATTGFLTTAIPTSFISIEYSIVLGIIGALLMALPDIIGELYAYFKNDNYEMYNKIHKNQIWLLKWIPHIRLHTYLDSFSHGEGRRWYAGIWYEYFMPNRYREMMWLESFMWIVNIFLIIIYYNIIK